MGWLQHFLLGLVCAVELQSVDELGGVGDLAGLEYLVISSRGLGVEDIVSDRVVEQQGLLLHQSEAQSERVDVVLLDIDAVNQDVAKLRIVEPVDELGDGGLA